jgi:hypothetical protein
MPGCDRGIHRGSHRNPWFEAIEQALGYKAPKQQQSRFAALANRAQDQGITPEQILTAARWIVVTWRNPKYLTINSLSEHLERALSPINQLTEAQLDEHRKMQERASRRERMTVVPPAGGVVSQAPREESR